MERLEELPKTDKNLTSPFLGVVAIATGPRMSWPYEKSRSIKRKRDGSTYSDNIEVWYPGFLFPYITGWEVPTLFKEISAVAESYLPFNTLKYRAESSKILKEELIKAGIITAADKHISKEQFFNLLMTKPDKKTKKTKTQS